jgi:23S rRNA (adenine2503-C2)-methyltransferase
MSHDEPVNLLDFDLEGLAAFLRAAGRKALSRHPAVPLDPPKGAADFAQMSDLAKSLRASWPVWPTVQGLPCDQRARVGRRHHQVAVRRGRGNAVEAVFIPEDDRGTLCVSSQAGCAVGCRFCSTGHQGFSRNLTTGEIVAQLWFAEHRCASAWVWRQASASSATS